MYPLLIYAFEHPCPTALKIRDLLFNQGVESTVVDSTFVTPLEFELFKELLSQHRWIITIDEKDGMRLMLNHFTIQNEILQAPVLNLPAPDMWVQFGSNIELMRELGRDAERIARRIVQEFFTNDYCPLPQREEKAIV